MQKHVRFRHRVVFGVLRPIIGLYARMAYGFRYTKLPQPKTPALIYANHNCNLDPFFVTVSCKMPLYFIASDHIFRLGWLSKLLSYLVAPIPIAKSQLDAQSIRAMLRVRDEGGAICLFPEGNRSFNGRTGYIAPAAAKLAKRIGLPLVLYRIEGSYLSTPRWGKGLRRGQVRGFVHSVIAPEAMRAMTSDELCERIRTALNVDAFAMQREHPIAYRGRARALYLQRVLYMCPQCSAIGSLTAQKHSVMCQNCGFCVNYDEYGFFKAVTSAEKPPFEDIYAWDMWQKARLKRLVTGEDFAETYANAPLFCDEDCELYRAERARAAEMVASGRLCMYSDRLELGSRVFRFENMPRANVYLSQTLQFSTNDGMFDIKSRRFMSASKYVNAFYYIKFASGGEPDGFISI